MDDSNFAALDSILSRVRRRTKDEAEEERREWAARCAAECDEDDEDDDEDANMLPTTIVGSDDDVRWGEWVEDGEEL